MGIVIIMGHFGHLRILQRTCNHGGMVGAVISGIPGGGRNRSWGTAMRRICARRAGLKGIGLVWVDAPTHPCRGKLARAA